MAGRSVRLLGSPSYTCIHLYLGDRPDGGREGGGEEVLRVGLPDQAPAHAVSYYRERSRRQAAVVDAWLGFGGWGAGKSND